MPRRGLRSAPPIFVTSQRGGSCLRFGGPWQSRTGRWSRAGSCPPPAAPTWTPSCTRTSGECSVCWSARRCRPRWRCPRSPTNSSWRAGAASARQRWWPGWGEPPRPPPTTRPWACKEEADAALFLFSFTDRASFEELPALMGRVLGPGDHHLVRVVVGTKFDLAPHTAVTEGDVQAFEGSQGLRVLRAGGAAGLARVGPVLDALVEELWRRDQVTAGVSPGDTGDTPS
ncbi:ciliogenesis and planar polarity effector 2 isoform X4 [Zonotrichia albicollis]|uniref:ciliogenesis and planar polarity effector 2 isoform X4 n=1 Tax=Zonotrichia albicollis TaxID=44394 RepID=UPI003D80F68E